MEIELRAKIDDSILKNLEKIDPVFEGEKKQTDEYFKFSGDIDRKLIMRIRETDNKRLLTFKGSSELTEDIA